MRTILTIVAVALVAVMSIALVAPYLIDWSTQRGEIEARLSAITGADVSLTGPVELRVLPTPYLALGEGLISAPGPDGAKLSFASARLELALRQACERADPVLRHPSREARPDPDARA